jgi:hypothetical protein
MVTTIETYSQNPLQPVLFPGDQRTLAGVFGNSLTLSKGTVLGRKTSDGKLYAYASGNSDGTQTAVGILMYDIKTDASGNIFFGDSAVLSVNNPANTTAPYFICGTFDTTELTGWDATAATAMKASTLAPNIIRIP